MKQRVDTEVIAELWELIGDRATHPVDGSYTCSLFSDKKGIDKVLEKVGEEATEFIIAVKNGTKERTAEEAADLLFHLLVALRASGTDLDAVVKELEHRRK
jgi:phosphoribosyl-ATP pyrophosphohydrolase